MLFLCQKMSGVTIKKHTQKQPKIGQKTAFFKCKNCKCFFGAKMHILSKKLKTTIKIHFFYGFFVIIFQIFQNFSIKTSKLRFFFANSKQNNTFAFLYKKTNNVHLIVVDASQISIKQKLKIFPYVFLLKRWRIIMMI